jgi:hypothetical protein
LRVEDGVQHRAHAGIVVPARPVEREHHERLVGQVRQDDLKAPRSKRILGEISRNSGDAAAPFGKLDERERIGTPKRALAADADRTPGPRKAQLPFAF